MFQEIKVLSKNNQNSGPQGFQGQNKWRNDQNNQSDGRSGQNNRQGSSYNRPDNFQNNRQDNFQNKRQDNFQKNRQDNFQNNRSTFNNNRGNNSPSENQRFQNNQGNSSLSSSWARGRPCEEKGCNKCCKSEEKYGNENLSLDSESKNTPENLKYNVNDTVVDIVTRSGKTTDKPLLKLSSQTQGNCSKDSDFQIGSLREKQLSDINLKVLIDWKEKGDKPVWEQISPNSQSFKFFMTHWDSLYIRDGLLYRKWESNKTPGFKWLIVLPKKLTYFVMEQLHNSVTEGHLGFKKTLAKVRERFTWYNQRKNVEQWFKFVMWNNYIIAPLQQYNVGAPFERIGKRDYFTKWMEAIPIQDMEATTVANELIERIVTIFGVAMEIHSDKG
ncbi:unnamed protein product [Mytilus coruscus]|uniref:Integrase zinc-binding domain-containing protein n=1 Tax=Mytilus coruscus TaxID=42192 RepID=A0A6J8A901_MYTCO|nr:unnamed protein product [Mytilus coruscus]